MLRSVASKVMRAGRAKVLLLGLAMMAAVLAASLLVLTVATKPAEAAFPGSNGAIAFGDGSQVYRMNSDGFGQTKLSDAAGTNFQPDRSADREQIAFSMSCPSVPESTPPLGQAGTSLASPTGPRAGR